MHHPRRRLRTPLSRHPTRPQRHQRFPPARRSRDLRAQLPNRRGRRSMEPDRCQPGRFDLHEHVAVELLGPPTNVIRLSLHPDGLAPTSSTSTTTQPTSSAGFAAPSTNTMTPRCKPCSTSSATSPHHTQHSTRASCCHWNSEHLGIDPYVLDHHHIRRTARRHPRRTRGRNVLPRRRPQPTLLTT